MITHTYSAPSFEKRYKVIRIVKCGGRIQTFTEASDASHKAATVLASNCNKANEPNTKYVVQPQS